MRTLLAHATLALPLIALAMGSCTDEKKGKDKAADEAFHAPVQAALAEAGLDVQPFETAAARPYQAEECARSLVSKLDVLVCRFGSPADAEKATARLRKKFIGKATTGAVRQREALLLAVADREKVDLSGKQINKLLKAFK